MTWTPPPAPVGYTPKNDDEHRRLFADPVQRRALRLEPPPAKPIERETIASKERICKEHGPYVAECFQPKDKKLRDSGWLWFQPRWTSCPTCNHQIQAEVDFREAEIHGGVGRKELFLRQRLEVANMPVRFRDSKIEAWQHGMDRQATIWEWARSYVLHDKVSIRMARSGIFLGAPGTGKTMLACAILRAIIEKGGSGYYAPLMDMLGRLKATYSNTATETEAAVIEQLTKVDLLVIDEIGRSLGTEYEAAQLFRILDARYRNRRPTLMVTNATREQVVTMLGPAIMDRVREAGGAIHVFDWASQRSSRVPQEEK